MLPLGSTSSQYENRQTRRGKCDTSNVGKALDPGPWTPYTSIQSLSCSDRAVATTTSDSDSAEYPLQAAETAARLFASNE